MFLHTVCSGIVDFMSDQAGTPSKQIQTVKQIQELIKDGDDAVIVGVFTDEGDAALEVYMEACKYNLLVIVTFPWLGLTEMKNSR